MSDTDHFDLAIVGAGIIGVVSAYLAQKHQKDWKILLVDRDKVGGGATWLSAGLASPVVASGNKKKLSMDSFRIYDDIKHCFPAIPIVRKKLIYLTSHPAPEHLKRYPNLSMDCLNKELVSFSEWLEITDNEQLIDAEEAICAAPIDVINCLVNHFESNKGTCLEEVNITAVEQKDKFFILKSAGEKQFISKRVLLALGPWVLSNPITNMLSLQNGFRLKKIVAFHIEQVPKPQDPVIYFYEERAFLMPLLEKGYWLLSITSQEWDCDPDYAKLHVNENDYKLALDVLRKYAPSLMEHCRDSRVFCDAYTTNWEPAVLHDKASPFFCIAGAGSGSGFHYAPAIASRSLALLGI